VLVFPFAEVTVEPVAIVDMSPHFWKQLTPLGHLQSTENCSDSTEPWQFEFQKRFASPCPKLVSKKLLEALIPEETKSICHARAPHGRASYTKLKGVSMARRKRVKPAEFTTSRIRFSPA